jgi:hypothetical protein
MLPGHVVHSKGRHISAKTTAFANVFVVGLRSVEQIQGSQPRKRDRSSP